MTHTADHPAGAPAGQMVSAGGIETHYHDIGDGEPVLLLHGSGPGVSAWANWSLTVPALAERHRVLAPDLVGFGYTERPDDIYYSLDTWIRHVWSFLDAMGVGTVSIVGNSLGGRIALGMAGERPERIARMVLMGAPGVGMRQTDGLRALRAYEPSEQNMRRLLLDCFAVDPSTITDDLVKARYQASVEPGAFEAYREMFFSPRHAGGELSITEDEVRAVETRSLLVHGMQDKVVPVDVAWNMANLLPDADLAVLSRCGHWTQIERSDDFNRLVGNFLEPTNADRS